MIQRIQTVYLFLIVVLQSILLLSNIAKYIGEQGEIILKTADFVTLAFLVSLTALIPAVSLFLYRRRMLQIRFNIFNSILLVVVQGFVLYYIIVFFNKAQLFTFSITSVFPVISLILEILAIKKIMKDELLIQSVNMNRLRNKAKSKK